MAENASPTWSPEFDPQFYKARYPDLHDKSDVEAWQHYREVGRTEGRATSPYSHRVEFLASAPESATILEIGPGHKPCFFPPRARYFDFLDGPGLHQRAIRAGEDPSGAPDYVHYVSPTADLTSVCDKFDVVFSSHSIEHQTDLVRHLQIVASLLKPGGAFMLIIPDRRYCFDQTIPATTIGEVIEAYAEKHTRHRLADVIDAHALNTHNDSVRHWKGDSPEARIDSATVQGAWNFYNQHDGYIDVHAQRFASYEFRDVLRTVSELGLSPFPHNLVWDTPNNSNEFCARLSL